MSGIIPTVAAELERLQRETGSDFAAFATSPRNGAGWRWTYACGNLNGRYTLLSIKPGRGIAGAALRTERVIVLDRHRHAPDLRKDDVPLISAERLEAAAAVPILLLNRPPAGLILIGSRTPRDYDDVVVQMLTQGAERLSAFFAQQTDQPDL